MFSLIFSENVKTKLNLLCFFCLLLLTLHAELKQAIYLKACLRFLSNSMISNVKPCILRKLKMSLLWHGQNLPSVCKELPYLP